MATSALSKLTGMLRSSLPGVVALRLLFFFSSPAMAFLNPIVISPNIVPSIPFDPNAAGIAPHGDGSGGEGETAVDPAPKEIFAYRHSRERTQQNLRNFIARTPNQGAKAELEKMFAAQPTIVEDIRQAIKVYGFDSHNVADAYAMWMIMAWLASEVRMEEPDRTTAQNVAQQVRNAFAATPDFAKTTDAERQEYAEVLLVQAFILAELIKSAGQNREVAAQLPQIARKGAQDAGLDLSKMTLTRNGFVPREAK